MSQFSFAFEQPWYLILLLLVPCLWYWSFHSLAGLGTSRRLLALCVRTVVLTLLIFALADLQVVRRSDRMTVIYLLDQSASIPAQVRDEMATYIVKDVENHRDDKTEDRASVIVFGREANIEVPPLDDDLPIIGRLETVSKLKRDATNLEAAMRLAQATFPEDSAKRLIIVTDGNENIGDARVVAEQLAEDGVGIDVVPIWLDRNRDVAVERLLIPTDIRRDQPFEARIVVNNLTPDNDENQSSEMKGRLRITRRRGGREEVLDESDVVLPAGKRVFSFKDELSDPDFYEYSAEFVAADATSDQLGQNNRATAYTHVAGRGHVLIIEDWENRNSEDGPGEFRYLAERLQQMGLDVTVQFSDELFTNLAELQRYDTVILANVPRSSGSTADNIQSFSDQQIDILVRNTQQMGCGLIMLGGPNSFGPGGWSNTAIEKAMPVDFRIRNAKVKAVGALAMVMHASEIPEGNYWQKVIGREALKALGPQDYAAVVNWDNRQGREGWLWGGRNGFLPVGGNARLMVARLDRMTPGDMPDFEPSLNMARAAFAGLKGIAVKHMICISDGDPTPPRAATLRKLKQGGVKVTTVAVGAHGTVGHRTLQDIARQTGGKYYVVRSPNALPKIYQKEARRIARPLIIERDIQPQLASNHEILRGIDSMPALQGFVLTTIKENALVEQSLLSPYPSTPENSTLLASWNYGLGKTAVFTSDAGKRWANDWTTWEQYDKFFGQLVRWSMRPTGNTGDFSVATKTEEGRTQIVVDALDKDEEFLNFLDVTATIVGPNMDAEEVSLRQTAPGRYVADVPTGQSGSYFVSIFPGAEQAPIRLGVNVPYSSEFRERQTNQELLKSLALREPAGGTTGILRGGAEPATLDAQFAEDSFRKDLVSAASSNFVWPWLLLLGSCLFFGDVFIRRVAVEKQWFVDSWNNLLSRFQRQDARANHEEDIARLRSRKEAVGEEIEERRAATKFQVDPEQEVDTSVLHESPSSPSTPKPEQRPSAPPEEPTEDFTSRLLKAKKDAMKERKKDN